MTAWCALSVAPFGDLVVALRYTRSFAALHSGLYSAAPFGRFSADNARAAALIHDAATRAAFRMFSVRCSTFDVRRFLSKNGLGLPFGARTV